MATSISPLNPINSLLSRPLLKTHVLRTPQTLKPIVKVVDLAQNVAALGFVGAGFFLTVVEPATAAAVDLNLDLGVLGNFQFGEPANALSLPTWAVHVSSVAEWITAMFLVWQYGEQSGFESWKGLSWGMVPALGGALCACTWHFFYNSESLANLVAIQGALTVLGNTTMCFAAFRIYQSSQERSKDL